MMIREILTQGDEFGSLRMPCLLVEKFDRSLDRLIDDMWDTMYAARGVGLAASQIGARLRVAVVDTIQRTTSYRRLIMINPNIDAFEGEQTQQEGCLSMPGLTWPIKRAAVVTVTFQGLTGVKRTLRGRRIYWRAQSSTSAITWTIQKQIASEFNERVSIKALQEQLRRYRRRR